MNNEKGMFTAEASIIFSIIFIIVLIFMTYFIYQFTFYEARTQLELNTTEMERRRGGHLDISETYMDRYERGARCIL